MTTSRISRFMRFAGLCGVVAPVLSFGLIFHAIAISPWFSWQSNALSDLGVYPLPSALVFNLALIFGGVLNSVLVLGVCRWIGPGWLGRTGTLILFVGTVALMLIGMFPKNHGGLHWIWAATYFLVTPMGYALLGAQIYRSGRRAHGAAALSAAVAAFLVIAFMPHDGLALPELVAAILLASRAFSMGMKLWLDTEQQVA